MSNREWCLCWLSDCEELVGVTHRRWWGWIIVSHRLNCIWLGKCQRNLNLYFRLNLHQYHLSHRYYLTNQLWHLFPYQLKKCTILTSTDGISWTSRTSSTTSDLNDVIYGNGLYIVVGESGTILTSSDGSSWTERTSGVTVNLNGISYGNGVYVVVGSSGTIITSSDGTSWTERSSGTTNQLNAVTYSE